jgi:hypothetical protein
MTSSWLRPACKWLHSLKAVLASNSQQLHRACNSNQELQAHALASWRHDTLAACLLQEAAAAPACCSPQHISAEQLEFVLLSTPVRRFMLAQVDLNQLDSETNALTSIRQELGTLVDHKLLRQNSEQLRRLPPRQHTLLPLHGTGEWQCCCAVKCW